MIEYKKIINDEIESIKEIYKACHWNAYLNDDKKLLLALQHSLFILGAYDKDMLIGFIRCVGDGEHIVFIQDLIVHPTYQKQGIGSSLYTRIINHYSHVRTLLLITDKEDKVSNAFYKRHQMREIEENGIIGYMQKK